jgi:aminoglycoside/choline kinase family phosphotransferase
MSEQLQSSLTMSQMLDAQLLCSTFNEHFGNKSEDLKVIKLAGDASSREYFRISKKAGKTSWVLQKSDPFLEANASVHPFLAAQKIFQNIGLPVPKVLGHLPVKGWILLEDLGDETLQTQRSFENYKAAIKLLNQLVLAADSNNVNAPHWSWAFDYEKLNFEMNFTAQNLVNDFLKLNGPSFLKATQINTQFLVDRPRFFCHRDFHSRNIMVDPKNQNLSIIDFQDARMGPITYDLVSLLWDPYVPLENQWKSKLMDVWAQEFQHGNSLPQYSRVQTTLSEKTTSGIFKWKIELERMIVQRMLKAAGSYASFYIKKKREDYLPSLYPALGSALESLENIRSRYKNEWTPQDGELLTQTEFILKALPASLKKA